MSSNNKTPEQQRQLLQLFKHDIRNGLGLDIELNNHSNLKLSQVLNTVMYFTQGHISRYAKKHSNWSLEVWIDQEGSSKNKSIICGMLLKKPGQKDIYVKKEEEQLASSVKSCVEAMEEQLRKEDKTKEHMDKFERHQLWRKEVAHEYI
jgi:hypothetical protein